MAITNEPTPKYPLDTVDVCKACSHPIKYVKVLSGRMSENISYQWVHTDYSPRHTAEPLSKE
jgi:hypothetical protein